MNEQHQYPTRGQIEQAVAEGNGWPRLTVDLVLALFPQPTPSARKMDDRAVEAFGPSVLERTGPPSITDMAPGTTFHGRIEADGRIQGEHEDRWTVRPDRGAECERHGAVFELYEFDPSTIRDVTPPESPHAI